MSWLLNRAMLTIFVTLVGAGIGAIVGSFVDARQLGPALGAAVAVGLCVLVDGLRALHLMDWLRGDLEREAPRDRLLGRGVAPHRARAAPARPRTCVGA